MRLYPEQLRRHLESGPARVYFVYGEEPLQREEAADAIRRKLRESGATREIFHVEAGFDAGALRAALANLGLFAERRLIELRLGDARPNAELAELIVAYCAAPQDDVVLLVIAGRLDARERKTRWALALTEGGVEISCWPIDAERLPAWIRTRGRLAGIDLTEGAARRLAERVEGNLLAARQEIDRLVLLVGPGRVEESTVDQWVGDHARYDAFAFGEVLLEGNASRIARVLARLREEGAEPPILIWAIGEVLRALAQGSGGTPVQRGARAGRQEALLGAAGRRIPPAVARSAIRYLARVDRIAKGLAPGDAWLALHALCMGMCGLGTP